MPLEWNIDHKEMESKSLWIELELNIYFLMKWIELKLINLHFTLNWIYVYIDTWFHCQPHLYK